MSDRPDGTPSMADIEGLAELATLLGAPQRHDKRGRVYWADGFEEGIFKWVARELGTGAAVEHDGTYARSGGWCCKLTGGSDGLRKADIARLMPYPVLGKMGFEVSFGFDGDLETLELFALLYDATHVHRPTVRYNYVEEKLEYRDSAHNWADLETGVDLYVEGYPFWTWKLVVDYEEEEYVRLIVNEATYSMSGLGYYKGAFVQNPSLKIWVANVTADGKNGVVYVDDVIVTTGEA